MPLVKAVSVKITVAGADDAQVKIGKVAAAAEELKRINPEITPKIDSARALLEARLLRAGITAELEKAVSEGGGGGFFSRLFGPKMNLGRLGQIPVALGVPGIAAAAAALPAILSVAPVLAAAAFGVAAFGALAMPTFKTVSAAITQISTDTKAYQSA